MTLAGKIFDYLTTNKPILLYQNDRNILEEIINNCNAGFVCSTEEEVISVLKNTYKSWAKTGIVHNNTKY